MGRNETGLSKSKEFWKYILEVKIMIFVTVGTHEQQFNRLIKEVDILKGENILKEEVFIQTGFSTYEPRYCQCKKLVSYREMNQKIQEARIVITHGGPASFIAPLQLGKLPIVVPRREKYGEHVNDHQYEFAKAVQERMGNIIVVEDISLLESCINGYDEIVMKMKTKVESNNKEFVDKLENIVKELKII